MFDGLTGAAAREGHHRPAAGLRLHRGNAEVFLAGQHQRPRIPVQVAQFVVADVAKEFNACGRDGAEPIRIGAGPHNFEPRSQDGGGTNGCIDSLVGHERRNHQEVVARSPVAWRVEPRVHRRVEYGGPTIIVPLNAPRNVSRVGDEAIDARCGVPIPARQPRHHMPGSSGPKVAEALRTEVRRELVPRVAHGRVAVADVHASTGGHHGFGRTVAGGHHKRRVVEVELLDGEREQRQVVAIPPCRRRQAVDE